MQGAFGVSAGELLALDVPPGPVWGDLVRRCWDARVAFLPLDPRLAARERDRIIDVAQPTAVLDAAGDLTPFASPAPVDRALAVVSATSGTAGRPKLVELSRAAVRDAIDASSSVLDVSTPWICVLPPAHVGGLLVLLRAAVGGTEVDIRERFDAREVIDLAAPARMVAVVPAMVSRLLATGSSLAHLTLLVGGDALAPPAASAARDRGARVVTTYGLTESCGGVVYDGLPLSGTEVRVLGDGAIELKGPTMMSGYRADPAGTGAAFTVDGWLRTGDLGAVDDDGRLTVSGRADDVIRTGGEKVWPSEVEAVLMQHPQVQEVAVVGAPHPEWGQQVVAFVVPSDPNDPPALEALRDWTSGRVARFKAPRRLTVIPELPRTASGKLKRSSLGV